MLCECVFCTVVLSSRHKSGTGGKITGKDNVSKTGTIKKVFCWVFVLSVTQLEFAFALHHHRDNSKIIGNHHHHHFPLSTARACSCIEGFDGGWMVALTRRCETVLGQRRQLSTGLHLQIILAVKLPWLRGLMLRPQCSGTN